MPMPARIAFVLALALSVGHASAAGAPAKVDPTGLWFTQKRDAKVKVTRCGVGLCAKVVWLAQPINRATLKVQTDERNHIRQRAHRPVLGIKLFFGVRPAGPDQWYGRVYNARDGKTYSTKLTQLGPNTMKLYACGRGICGAEIWSKK